jgi:hypothetical protein
MKAIPRYETARITILASVSGGARGRHQSGTRARSRERDRKDDGARVGRPQR